jgi:hypothetical protein
MTDSARKVKDYLSIVISLCVLVGTILGWVLTSNKSAAEDAVMKADVERLKTEWAEHDFDVMEYKVDQIMADVREIKELLKE